ncbi:MAG: sugar phosphate isomerase/epimerase family protein [Acetivibrionales bacterium]|jgi:protein FrlC
MVSVKREQVAGMNQHYKNYPLDYFLDAQQRLGLTSIELWLGAPHFWLDSISYDDCKSVYKKVTGRGLKVVSVTSPSMAYQYQYAPQEKSQFEKCFRYFSNGIKAAAELGAKIMTVNSGRGYWNDDADVAFRRSCEMIGKLCRTAESEGIVLALESLTPMESNIAYNLETTERLFHEVNHPALKIMVDTVATGYSDETIRDWYETFGDNLIHMHFIDGDRRTYAHCAWGDGVYSLEQELGYLNEFNYTGYLVQEIMDDRYLADPLSADIKNLHAVFKFVRD